MVACLPHTRGSKLCLQMPSTASAEVPWKRWRSLSSRSISDMRRDMYSFFLRGGERRRRTGQDGQVEEVHDLKERTQTMACGPNVAHQSCWPAGFIHDPHCSYCKSQGALLVCWQVSQDGTFFFFYSMAFFFHSLHHIF